MEYLKKFDSWTAYNTALENGEIPTPSVCLVEGRVVYKPINVTKAGDIAVYDKADKTYRIIDVNAYEQSYFHDRTLMPIGVVAAPSTHTPDHTSRIVSLVNMSLQTPDKGSVRTGTGADVQGDIAMYWGGHGVDLGMKNYPSVPKVNPLTGETTGTTDWMRIPSDYRFNSTGYVDPVSGNYYYYNNYETEDRFGPSPYKKDGSKNPQYFVEGLATNDFDGRGNTDIIMAAVTANWQTGTIENSYAAGNYPPACACSRFSTIGTKPGDWYLPAEGELAFIIARHVAINNSLNLIASKGGIATVRIGNNNTGGTYGYWCWSSTEYSSTYSRDVTTDYGYVHSTTKSGIRSNNRVRAFFAL